MEVVLGVATIVGGIAAIWFFWDKIFGDTKAKKAGPSPSVSLSSNPTKENIERAILESDAKIDWSRGGDDNRSVVSYVHDMNLRFETLFTDDGKQCDDFREPWANCHPDPNATGYWCNLYYGTTLVERFILVSVDGARAMVPVPKVGKDGYRPDTVLPLDYKVAQIHDSLETLDEYLERSHLKVSGAAA